MALLNGQPFPMVSASRPDGIEMTLPDDLESGWSVLLFYRGVW